MNDYPFIRALHLPLTSAQLRPLDRRCRTIQFNEPLSGTDLERVAEFAANYPEVTLRIYGHRTYETLDFLKYFGHIQHVQIEIWDLQDVSGFQFLQPALLSLGFGSTKKRFSLRHLERFTSLRALWLEGHAKDFEVIGKLTALRSLSLRSITLENLAALRTLKELDRFELKLGGTRDLRHLPEIGKLSYFEAWLVRGLADLSPLVQVSTLQFIFLQALKHVVTLPSLAPLKMLRRVHLETMKGLRDLASVAAAPALEELIVIDMSHLVPEAFLPFVGHAALRAKRVGLGSRKKNAAVDKLLPLPDVTKRMAP